MILLKNLFETYDGCDYHCSVATFAILTRIPKRLWHGSDEVFNSDDDVDGDDKNANEDDEDV